MGLIPVHRGKNAVNRSGCTGMLRRLVLRAAKLVLAGVVFAQIAPISSAVAKQVETDTGNYYEDGQNRFDSGDIRGAVIQLKNALRQNPSNLPARILIGQAYLKLGDVYSAEKELRRARIEGADEELLIVPLASAMHLLGQCHEVLDEIGTEGRSKQVEAGLHVVRGQCYLEQASVLKAQTEFERAEVLQPDAAMPRVGLSRVLMRRGEMFAAREKIHDAIAVDRDNFYVWFIAGQIARRLGDTKAALENFDKSVALEPEHMPARISRARLLVEVGRHRDAVGDLEILKKNLPNNPFTAYIDALVKERDGDREGFQHSLNRVDTLLRGMDRGELLADPSLLLLAGVINYALRNYNEAHNYLREHVVRDRFHAGSRKLLGRILMRRGTTQDALTMFLTAVDLAPSDPELRRLVGVALMRLGRYQQAAEAFEKAIELNPRAPTLRTDLALSQLRRGKASDAIVGLEAALAEEPDAVEASIMLGLILVRERKYDKAVQVLQRAVEQNPENPVPYNIMASALWALGDTKAAREKLERAVRLNPTYLSAHRNLARMDMQSGAVKAAKQRFQAMLQMPGASERPLIDLAQIAVREGNLREAISLLSKAREQAPENVNAQIQLTSLLARTGDGDAALRNIRKLDNKHPENAAVIEQLGEIELKFGKRDNAVIAFRRLSEAVPNDPSQYLRVARYQIRVGDVNGAHSTLKRALVVDDGHLGVLEEIVRLESRLGLFEDALLRSSHVIKRYPKRANGNRLRGDIFVKMRRFDKAALAYAAAIEIEPSGQLYVRQYHARRAAGVEKPSLRPLEAWVKSNLKDYRSRRTLAEAYLHAGRAEESIALYESLAAEQPRDPVVQNNLAWLYLEAGDKRRALQYAERAHKLAPKQAQTLDTLGWILTQTGDTARGLELLRDAYARASRRPELRYHLAFALVQQGQVREAKRHLQALLQQDNVSTEVADKTRALLSTIEDS